MELRFARRPAAALAAFAALAALVGCVLLAVPPAAAQVRGPPGDPGDGPWRWFLTTEEPPFWLRPRPRPRPRPSPSRQATTFAPDTPSTTPMLVDVQGSPVNCPCPATSEYNPVCGSNGATYNSPVKLRCAQRCGYVVTLEHYGQCPRTTAAP